MKEEADRSHPRMRRGRVTEPTPAAPKITPLIGQTRALLGPGPVKSSPGVGGG